MSETTVALNGRVVDLAKALPLTVGDWRALKKRGVTPAVLRRLEEDPDFDVMATWMHFVLAKADPSITEADVDALKPRELTAVAKRIGAMAKDEDDPLSVSPSSTASLPSTGGASGISSS